MPLYFLSPQSSPLIPSSHLRLKREAWQSIDPTADRYKKTLYLENCLICFMSRFLICHLPKRH